jgi:hypothetical protein
MIVGTVAVAVAMAGSSWEVPARLAHRSDRQDISSKPAEL